MAGVVLDWRRHPLGARRAGCRYCHLKTWLRDEQGRPAHKVCAERDLERRAAAAAAPPTRRKVTAA